MQLNATEHASSVNGCRHGQSRGVGSCECQSGENHHVCAPHCHSAHRTRSRGAPATWLSLAWKLACLHGAHVWSCSWLLQLGQEPGSSSPNAPAHRHRPGLAGAWSSAAVQVIISYERAMLHRPDLALMRYVLFHVSPVVCERFARQRHYTRVRRCHQYSAELQASSGSELSFLVVHAQILQ